jgi:hypothetical protein
VPILRLCLLLSMLCALPLAAQNGWEPVDANQPLLLFAPGSIRKTAADTVECRAKLLGPKDEELLIDLRYDMQPPAVLVVSATSVTKTSPPTKTANPNAVFTPLSSLEADNPYVLLHALLKRRGF